jgi:diguanylate cyclase (GGDEF)-like protein
MRRSDGRYIWVEGRYRFLPQDGTILAMLRDITAQKRAELALAETVRKLEASNRLLARLANRDGLTGIANRRCFDDRLDAEFRRSVRQHLSLSVVMIDVDCFKLYNDRYGHVAGDKCLMRIAAAVAGALLRPGDLAARYGGEEIAVLLPATDLAGAIVIAERIRLAVADLAIPHAGNLHGVATISAGVSAVRPRRTNDQPGDLVEAADRALYRAKTDGRNRVRGGFSSDTVRDQHAEYVATA